MSVNSNVPTGMLCSSICPLSGFGETLRNLEVLNHARGERLVGPARLRVLPSRRLGVLVGFHFQNALFGEPHVPVGLRRNPSLPTEREQRPLLVLVQLFDGRLFGIYENQRSVLMPRNVAQLVCRVYPLANYL